MRILNATETRRCLPMADAIEAMEDAFGPDRQLPQRELVGSSMFMPGRVGRQSGIKVVSIVPGNPAGIVAVFDEEGELVGIVDGPTLTAIRTAAGAGLATRIMARGDASVMAMLGAGAMARDQIAAVKQVRTIEQVILWSRQREKAERLGTEIGAEVADTSDDAVQHADVITTATPARTPLFTHTSVAPDTHINAIGAFTPEMVEIPSETVQAAFCVVDDRGAASVEAGDLLKAGVEPDAEIGDLLGGSWNRPAGVTLFKSVGIASQDIAAARTALANAELMGVGTVV